MLQLRYLQTLNSISAEHNSTIIFPVPIDIISNFMQFQQSGNMDIQPQQQQQQYYQQYQQFQQFQQMMQQKQCTMQVILCLVK